MVKRSNVGKGRDILEGNGTTVPQAAFLDELYKEVDKDFGGLDRADDEYGLWCPTGSAALDFILTDQLKGGGWPFGRLIEIYGNSTTGKSMLGLLALKETIHRLGGVGLLLDVENALVAKFYRMLGGDPHLLAVKQPDYIEDVYTFASKFIRKVRAKSKDIPLTIVYDSLPASICFAEYKLGGSVGKPDMSKRALAHRQGYRELLHLTKKTPTLWITINSLVATMAKFGPDQDTVGGTAPKLWSTIRLHLKNGKKLYVSKGGKLGTFDKDAAKGSQQLIGMRSEMEVEKTRYTAPFRRIGFDILYKGGIHPYSGWFQALQAHSSAFQPAFTKDGKERAGYFAPAGVKPEDEGYGDKIFTANTFYKALPGLPNLLTEYPFDPDFGLPDESQLIEVEVGSDGGEEQVDREEGGAYSEEPTSADEV